MKRLGLVLHAERDIAVEWGRRLAETVSARGVEIEALPADAARLGDPVAASVSFPDGLDLVVVLGGDGTLLRAVQLLGGAPVPVLGVNLGRLGFLSELERSELDDGLTRLLDGGFDVEERMLLVGEIVQDGRGTPVRALNDIIVEKVDIGRAIKLSVSIGGEPFVAWAADGIIVASATGSTAYSFSAGGPVVSPRIDCIIVTPVSPHGLFDRTVIVPPDEEVLISLIPDPDRAALSADGGPPIPLSAGAEVRIRASEDRVRLAKLTPVPFWQLVREKFGLPADPRA